MKPLFSKVTIIGVGLIGGSLGMAICSRGLADKVIGFDIDPANLMAAIHLEAIHEGEPDLTQACAGADLVIIGTPVGSTLEVIKTIAPVLEPECIVTDVGSTKSQVVREASRLMPPNCYFVGGHPMAGSEHAGVGGADPFLFENAVYILTPTAETSPAAADKIRVLIAGTGARIVELDPEEHDLMVAGVSHLPFLVATSLVNTAGSFQEEHEGILVLAAGGFRDTTRIASGHPQMWKDICLSNRGPILVMLDRFQELLGEMRGMVEAGDDQGLRKLFDQARGTRMRIPEKVKGYLALTHEIIVTVPDRPGVIGLVAGALGEAGVNITDIEILRIREGEGGTLRISLSSEAEQAEAIEILRKKGIQATRRHS